MTEEIYKIMSLKSKLMTIFLVVILVLVEAVAFFQFSYFSKIFYTALCWAAVVYGFFNIYDLRYYDKNKFCYLTGRYQSSLWFINYNNNLPYRLKEMIFDQRFIARFIRENKWLSVIFFVILPILISLITVYICLLVPLTVFQINNLVAVIFVAKLAKLDITIKNHSKIITIDDWSSLAYFFFKFNPQTFAFALTYLILSNTRKDRNEITMVMEKILFNKLIGKSRWFLLIVSLLIQEALKLETKMEWGRKKKNYRNMRYTAFLFVNDFVLRNCVKTHQNICSFKITIIEGKIKLNLRKEAVVLLKAIKSSSLKNPINKPNIQNSLIEVGKQKHVGITYITEKNDEITFGSTQTTKKIFYIQKSKFCTEKHNKNAPLRYPRTADEILGLKDYEQGKDDQYVVHSHIIGESVRPIEILRNEDLSSIEFKARCLKALQILKKKEEEDLINKRIQEIEESIIGKLGTENLQLLKNQINLPRKNKFLIQHAAPNQGEVVDEEDLLKRLSIREQDFIYNATMLSLELKNYLEDLEGYEKIITIDQTHDYIENLDTNDFYELLIDANLSDLSEN